MHFEDRLFWQRCANRYPHYFASPSKVIDFGSLNVNGVIGDWVKSPFYIGVDWKPGPNVDLISLAHEVPFRSELFDMVVSSSMLEHDPYWDKSLTKMVDVLKKDGIFIITWGAALNPEHFIDTAPDNKFHPLRAGLVIQLLKNLGLYIHEFQYARTICLENNDEGFIKSHFVRENKMYGMGEVVLVAFKDKVQATGKRVIEPLIDEDKI